MSKLLVLCVAICAFVVFAKEQDVAPIVEDPYGGGGGGGGGMMMGGGKMGGGKMGGGKMGGGKMGGGKMGGGGGGGGGGKMGGGGVPKAPHSTAARHSTAAKAPHSTAPKHSTAHKAATGVHASTGAHAPTPVKSVPISAPVPGGWALPTEPTERLRIPLPDAKPIIVEDPYGGGGGGGGMMMGGGKMGGGKMGGGKMGGGKMGGGGGGSMGGGKMGGGGAPKMGGGTGSGSPKSPGTNTPKKGGSPTDTGSMTSNGATCQSFADANYLCSTAACTSKVAVGAAQPNYQCAEFVARTIASTGKIPGLTAGSSQSAYGSFSYNGKTYDLLWTSHRVGGPLGLEDYLLAAGWKAGGSVQDCSVVFVNGSAGAWGHVAVGVGANLLDAHNNARLHLSPTAYTVNAVYNK